MVMYCTLPTKGGSTNFRNSGVHVKPVKGNAIFFSYIDPETKLMDNGFTEHSGCPVYEGEKKIVTQWIRYGVDNENKWDSFNTREYKRVSYRNMLLFVVPLTNLHVCSRLGQNSQLESKCRKPITNRKKPTACMAL